MDSEQVPYENTLTFNDDIFSMSTVLINPRFKRDDVYVSDSGQNTLITLITSLGQHHRVYRYSLEKLCHHKQRKLLLKWNIFVFLCKQNSTEQRLSKEKQPSVIFQSTRCFKVFKYVHSSLLFGEMLSFALLIGRRFGLCSWLATLKISTNYYLWFSRINLNTYEIQKIIRTHLSSWKLHIS